MNSKKFVMVVFFMMILATGSWASDLSYPSKTVQIIVPASPGGGTDVSARIVAMHLEKKFGVPFVVSNITGAGGAVAAREVMGSAPNGYTILWWHNGLLVNKLTRISNFSIEAFEIGPIIFQDNSNGLFANANSKYKDFDTLINEAKKNPGKITYATEFGSFTYLQGLALNEVLGIQLKLVDIGPDAQKRAALLGGHVDIAPGLYGTYRAQVDAGDFIYLCVLSNGSKFVPDVPSVKQLGYDFSFDGYSFGMFFPKGTPKEIINTIAEALEELSLDSDFIKDAEKQYLEVVYKDPEEATEYWSNLEDSYSEFEELLTP